MSKRRRKKGSEESTNFLDSRLFKVLSKVALGLVIVMIFLTLSQCTIKKPEAPTWDTQLTVPVINRTYTMEELIRRIDQDGIGFGADSAVVYTVSEDIDTFRLDEDDFTTDPLSYAVSEQLAPVTIDPPAIAPVVLNVSEISGLAAFIPGAVPPGQFSIDDTLTVATFSTAQIASGSMFLVVQNNLGISLDSMHVYLYNVGDATPFSDDVLVDLASPDVDSVAVPLAGRTLTDSIRVYSDCYTAGGTVLSSSDKDISTAARFPGQLTVDSAVAEVPGFTRNFSEQVDLSETDVITGATLSNGLLTLIIDNNTPLEAYLRITIPSLSSGGQPFELVDTVNSLNPVDTVVRSLAGYLLEPSGASTPQQIDLQVEATVPGTGSSQVGIGSSSSFGVEALIDSLAFASVTGIFSATQIDLDPTSQDIDVPEGFDQIELVEAFLTLNIHNAVAMPCSLYVQIDGSNGKQRILSGNIAAGSPGSPVTTRLYDSLVADFFNPIPDNIQLSGAAFLTSGTEATITPNDFIFGDVEILAPLAVVINTDTVDTDIESEDIDQEDIDIITDHVNEARFIYNVVSHLPLGARLGIYIGPDSATLYQSYEVLIDDIGIVAAPTDPVTGIATADTATGFQTVLLTNDQIRVLENEKIYIGTLIELQGSGGPVRLTKDDYVQVLGRFEVDYRFDGEF